MSPQRESQGPLRFLLMFALIAVLAVIWFAWSRQDRLGFGSAADPEAAPAGASGQGPQSTDEGPAASESDAARAGWTALLGRPPEWPADLSTVQDCSEVEADLARICAVLDSRYSDEVTTVPGGSCGLLQGAARALAARPPVITSELKSYESILANVFHLFRALGRERLDLVRRIVREQEELTEPGAMALHRWLISRERCARSGTTPIKMSVLYDYAGFLFQTMGGQAYLRRRSPESEALIAFYALLIVDRADRDGHNPHGVDPRPEIRRTRAMIATGPLVFADEYVAVLDAMSARWERRTLE